MGKPKEGKSKVTMIWRPSGRRIRTLERGPTVAFVEQVVFNRFGMTGRVELLRARSTPLASTRASTTV